MRKSDDDTWCGPKNWPRCKRATKALIAMGYVGVGTSPGWISATTADGDEFEYQPKSLRCYREIVRVFADYLVNPNNYKPEPYVLPPEILAAREAEKRQTEEMNQMRGTAFAATFKDEIVELPNGVTVQGDYVRVPHQHPMGMLGHQRFAPHGDANIFRIAELDEAQREMLGIKPAP